MWYEDWCNELLELLAEHGYDSERYHECISHNAHGKAEIVKCMNDWLAENGDGKLRATDMRPNPEAPEDYMDWQLEVT